MREEHPSPTTRRELALAEADAHAAAVLAEAQAHLSPKYRPFIAESIKRSRQELDRALTEIDELTEAAIKRLRTP